MQTIAKTTMGLWAILSTAGCLQVEELRAPEGLDYFAVVTLDESGPTSVSKLEPASFALFGLPSTSRDDAIVVGFSAEDLLALDLVDGILDDLERFPLKLTDPEQCEAVATPRWAGRVVDGAFEDLVPKSVPTLTFQGAGSRCARGESCFNGRCGDEVIDITAGQDYACLLLARGEVYCWGSDWHGRTGQGSGGVTQMPLPVAQLDSVVQIDAGFDHTCGRTERGEVLCWGDDWRGQLGPVVTTFGFSERPLPLALAGSATDITAGSSHSCAAQDTGRVTCWGSRAHLALGAWPDEEDFGQITLEEVADVQMVVAGRWHTCALLKSGAIWCWGDSGGFLPEPLDDETSGVPTNPTEMLTLASQSIDAPVDIAARKSQTCVLLKNNRLRCFGSDPIEPELNLGELEATSIVSGGNNSCVTTQDGRVFCFGRDMPLWFGAQAADDVVEIGADQQLRKVSLSDDYLCGISQSSEVWCYVRDVRTLEPIDSPVRVWPL